MDRLRRIRRKIRGFARAIGPLLSAQQRAAERVFAVGGEGYDEAKKHFQRCTIESERMIVQMATADAPAKSHPVEVSRPLTRVKLLDAGKKKFRTVSKLSRIYDGVSGAELTAAEVTLSGQTVVFSGKGGWRGAATAWCSVSGSARASCEHLW